eukprot:SAG31_NODE_21603_length_545_cov_1.248879_1_plen_93_part_01
MLAKNVVHDHAVNVTYYCWDAQKTSQQTICAASTLNACLRKAYSEACDEMAEAKAEWAALESTEEGRREKVRTLNANPGHRPMASRCRWFHMA